MTHQVVGYIHLSISLSVADRKIWHGRFSFHLNAQSWIQLHSIWPPYQNLRREYNSLTPKIALVILTVCLSIHILVFRRI